jgi:hypothetical protein
MDPTRLEVPEEFRPLGELRQVFATTAGAIAVSVVRSVVPLALGCGRLAVAEYWIAEPNWKCYLALGLGLLLALQGVRLLVRTALRRNQKVLIFENGIAIWRYGQMATYRWDQVEQVEAVVAKAEGAPTSFLSFSFRARTDGGETRTYNFHPAGDPIPNLKGLWKVIEEGAGRGRAAGAIAALEAGEEVTFQRTVWGTVVSTQIGISLFGIRAKPRYDDSRFLDWSWVERIAVVDRPTAPQAAGSSSGGIPHLEVLRRFRPAEPWVSELASEIPGYQALIEAAEFARRRFTETTQELHRERLPTALAVIAAGQEFRLGLFGVGRAGFRHEAETIPWDDLGYLHFDREGLVPSAGNRTFPYGSLTLADRWLLQMAAQSAHYDHDYPDAGGGGEDDEPREDDRG